MANKKYVLKVNNTEPDEFGNVSVECGGDFEVDISTKAEIDGSNITDTILWRQTLDVYNKSEVNSKFINSTSESLTSIQKPTLVGNVLTLKYVGENGILQEQTVNLSNLSTIDKQIYKTISSNTTLDDSFHNTIVWITANATITIPIGLRDDFNCVFDAVGAGIGTFVAGSGITFSAPFGLVLRDNAMCTLYRISTSNFRLNGGLISA